MKQVEECDKVLERLFEKAEIAKFTTQEIREYEASKMAYRDIKNSIDTAKREGRIEANIETAHVCWLWDFQQNRLLKRPNYLLTRFKT